MTIENIKIHLRSGIDLFIALGEELDSVLDKIKKLDIDMAECSAQVDAMDLDTFKLSALIRTHDLVVTKMIFKDGSFNAMIRSEEVNIYFKSWEFDSIQIDKVYFNSEAIQKSTITIDKIETNLHANIVNWLMLTDVKNDTIHYENADVINDSEFDELIIAIH